MSNPFQKATREGLRLRVVLLGLSGAGKTYTALALAAHLGGRVAVIDTEEGSASRYAGERCQCASCRGHGVAFDFDVLDLKRHSPRDYLEAQAAAAANGYQVLVIDSISHEWAGRGGCLEMVDAGQGRNKFAKWGPVTAQHEEWIRGQNGLLQWPGHVIGTCRAKEKFSSEGGKVVSLGVQPIQRDGIEYEFDVAVFLNGSRGTVVKSRASSLSDRTYDRPGKELAEALASWAGGQQERPAPEPNPNHNPLSRPAGGEEPLPASPPAEAREEFDADQLDAARADAMREAAPLDDDTRAKVRQALDEATTLERVGQILKRVRQLTGVAQAGPPPVEEGGTDRDMAPEEPAEEEEAPAEDPEALEEARDDARFALSLVPEDKRAELEERIRDASSVEALDLVAQEALALAEAES